MEPLKGKHSDISRPINDSFRHTGHGSVLGNSWGNPSFLDPQFLGDDKNAKIVHLRGIEYFPNQGEFTFLENLISLIINFSIKFGKRAQTKVRLRTICARTKEQCSETICIQ